MSTTIKIYAICYAIKIYKNKARKNFQMDGGSHMPDVLVLDPPLTAINSLTISISQRGLLEVLWLIYFKDIKIIYKFSIKFVN